MSVYSRADPWNPPWVSHGFVVAPWDIHETPNVGPWDSHGLLMGLPMLDHGCRSPLGLP